MVYELIRNAISIVLLIVIVILLWQGKKNLKPPLIIGSVLLWLALSSVIYITPFERKLIEFNTPEEAFWYAFQGTIYSTVYSNDCAFVMNSGDNSVVSVPRIDGSWRCPDYSQKTELDGNDDFMSFKCTDRVSEEMIVCIIPFSDAKDVSDNVNGPLKKTPYQMTTAYYSIIDSDTESYVLTYNGKAYNLKSR